MGDGNDDGSVIDRHSQDSGRTDHGVTVECCPLQLPVAYRRRIGGQSEVAGSLRGSLRAGTRIMTTFARVAMEPARRGEA